MIILFRIVLVLILLSIFIKKSDYFNKILEKRILLNLLLFAVSLFILNEKEKKVNFLTKLSRFISQKLLFLDLWLLNYRSNTKSEKLFIRDDKKNTKGPNC